MEEASTTYVGLDVHKESIDVTVAEEGAAGKVRHFYRALADQFERFLAVYEDRFERTHGFFRRALKKAVYRYLDCGIFAHGVARAHCSACGRDLLIAF